MVLSSVELLLVSLSSITEPHSASYHLLCIGPGTAESPIILVPLQRWRTEAFLAIPEAVHVAEASLTLPLQACSTLQRADMSVDVAWRLKILLEQPFWRFVRAH